MRIKQLPTQTITIVNRLKSKDNKSNRDVFVKKVLTNCIWDSVNRAIQNGRELSYSNGYSVEIPDNQTYEYKPYEEWITDTEKAYTLSVDDYIIMGEVAEKITPNNITNITRNYFSFKVKVINDYRMKADIPSNNFLMQYASYFYVEGD